MISDLKLALMLKERQNVREFVVSEDVFREVLRELGDCERASLNMPHDSVAYRYLHHVSWQGARFIHMSRNAISAPWES